MTLTLEIREFYSILRNTKGPLFGNYNTMTENTSKNNHFCKKVNYNFDICISLLRLKQNQTKQKMAVLLKIHPKMNQIWLNQCHQAKNGSIWRHYYILIHVCGALYDVIAGALLLDQFAWIYFLELSAPAAVVSFMRSVLSIQ